MTVAWELTRNGPETVATQNTTNKIGTQYTSILFQWFGLVSHPWLVNGELLRANKKTCSSDNERNVVLDCNFICLCLTWYDMLSSCESHFHWNVTWPWCPVTVACELTRKGLETVATQSTTSKIGTHYKSVLFQWFCFVSHLWNTTRQYYPPYTSTFNTSSNLLDLRLVIPQSVWHCFRL